MPRIAYFYHAPGTLLNVFGQSCVGGIQDTFDFTASGNFKVWQHDGVANFDYVDLAPAALFALTQLVGVFPGPPALDQTESDWRWNSFLVACAVGGYNAPAGYLSRSAVQVLAETSEKAQIAFTVGSVFTAAACELAALRHGNPSNFMHFNRFFGLITTRWNNQRPDYISRFGGVGAYQLWEAKGSGGGTDNGGNLTTGQTYGGQNGMLTDAMWQVWNINTVNLNLPNARVGVMAQGYNDGTWRMRVADPSSIEGGGDDPEESDAMFIAFYRPWLEALDVAGKSAKSLDYAGNSFLAVAKPSGEWVGLDQRIVDVFGKLAPEVAGGSSQTSSKPGALTEALLDVLAKPYTQDKKQPTGYVTTNGLFAEVADAPWLKRLS